jgi:hypothetical protein
MRAALVMIKQISDMPNDPERAHLLRIFAVRHAGCDPDEVAFLADEEILAAWGSSVTDTWLENLGSPVVDFEADRRE